MSETPEDRAQGAEPAARAGAPKRRGSGSRRHTVGYVLLASVVVLALVTALSVAFLYRHLNGNLTVEDVSEALGDNRPEKVATGPQEPINVLVMGSDTREGEGNAIDGEAGAAASDTTVLFHLSADRERAYGISIPRDSIVERPDCGVNDQIPGGENKIWNEAFTVGGQACTIEQFEANTGVFVDHYVVVDFAGFEDMVDAIGGVPVCIPEDIVDPAHDIFIPAGERELQGEEARQYVRVRYTLGDGSDLGRIKRQQAFMASLVNKVISAGTLTRLDRLIGFLNAATQSLTVDPGLDNLTRLGRLGMQFQGIGLDNINFVTVPNAYYPADSEYRGRVYWTKDAKKLWRAVRNDEQLPPELLEGAISAAKPPGKGDGKGGKGNGGGGSTDEDEDAQAAAAGLCA